MLHAPRTRPLTHTHKAVQLAAHFVCSVFVYYRCSLVVSCVCDLLIVPCTQKHSHHMLLHYNIDVYICCYTDRGAAHLNTPPSSSNVSARANAPQSDRTNITLFRITQCDPHHTCEYILHTHEHAHSNFNKVWVTIAQARTSNRYAR